MKDLYKILGVKENATEKEINTAYRKLCIDHHKNKISKEEMKNITRAKSILTDKQKRQEYDMQQKFGGSFNFGSGGFNPFGGSSFGSFNTRSFSSGFGGGGSFFKIINDFFGGGGYEYEEDETISIPRSIVNKGITINLGDSKISIPKNAQGSFQVNISGKRYIINIT